MKISAGILLYNSSSGQLEVLLVHPGGPFFKNKDEGAWSIPKGEVDEGENPRATAVREFKEELGTELNGELIELTPITQKGGKKVLAWAVEGHLDVSAIICNTFTIEWPPRSGRMQDFPEIDKAEWFTVKDALLKINSAQRELIRDLEAIVSGHF